MNARLNSASRFSGAAICLLALSCAPAALGQQNNPLAGQWHCTSTAMRMPAFKNIPAGRLVQSTSYKADEQGRWASNSILQYQADQGGGHLRVHSTASGVHAVAGQIVTEHVQRFQIMQTKEADDAFARTARPAFHAILKLNIQQNPRQRYRLLQHESHRYVMQPLTSSGHDTKQRITCQRR